MATATMTFFTVDTLQLSKRLQKAGLQQTIADEFAEAIKDTQNQSIDGLATKESFTELRNEVALLKKDIELSKNEILLKMFLMLTAAVGIITWLDKVVK